MFTCKYMFFEVENELTETGHEVKTSFWDNNKSF